MYLVLDRHSRSLLSGDLHQKILDLRLKDLEDDVSIKFLTHLYSQVY